LRAGGELGGPVMPANAVPVPFPPDPQPEPLS
jgi:hypothetical protein